MLKESIIGRRLQFYHHLWKTKWKCEWICGTDFTCKGKMSSITFRWQLFYANVNGLSWFIERILPQVNAKLIVVGANMDKLSFKNNENWKYMDLLTI